MPSDTTGPSSRDDPRRPVVIDLPAEEVGRLPAGDRENPALAGLNTPGEIPSDDGQARPASVWPEHPAEAEHGGPAAAEATASGISGGGDGEASVAPAALAPPGKRRTSFGALLGAALLGGGVAAGGLYALDRFEILPLGAERADRGPDVAAEVARLEQEIAGLREAGAATPAPVDIAPVREQIAALEQSIAELRQQPAGAPADGPALQDVQDRLAQLEQTAAALQSTPSGASDPALATRLTELSGEIDALKASAGGAGTSEQVAELGRRLDEVTARLGAVESRPPVDLSPLESGLQETRGQVQDLSGRLEALPDEERVAALETGLTETSRKADLAAALGPAVAADALGAAVQSGAPYTAELAALRTLDLDPAALAALEPHAQNGLPTLARLRAEFESLSREVDLAAPIPAGSGTFERLVQSARSLVEVRSASPVPGSDPNAVIARIRGALDSGDLKAVLAEWNALPEVLKTRTADWVKAVQARSAAEDVVARLRSEALSSLGEQG